MSLTYTNTDTNVCLVRDSIVIAIAAIADTRSTPEAFPEKSQAYKE